MKHLGKQLLLIGLAMLTAGCAGNGMMPTPNLYRDPASQPFASVPPQLQNNQATVIYATDRLNENLKSDRETPSGPIDNEAGRSMALAIGICQVHFGKNLPWPALVRESTDSIRLHNPSMAVSDIREAARFAATPYPLNLIQNPHYGPVDYDAEPDTFECLTLVS